MMTHWCMAPWNESKKYVNDDYYWCMAPWNESKVCK